MLSIDNIIISQHGLRDQSQLPAMVDFVRSGGVFSDEALHSFCQSRGIRCSPKIYISRFPDGQLYYHDGHHRARAIFLAGRNYLDDREYVIKNWTYEEYTRSNLHVGFVTPFDPRTEVRLANFRKFKESVAEYMKSLAASGASRGEISLLIDRMADERADEYKRPRIYTHISDILRPLNVKKEAVA